MCGNRFGSQQRNVHTVGDVFLLIGFKVLLFIQRRLCGCIRWCFFGAEEHFIVVFFWENAADDRVGMIGLIFCQELILRVVVGGCFFHGQYLVPIRLSAGGHALSVP